MHIRRLVKAGQASHTVSLPKSWLDKFNLKKGDTIYINELEDSLLISPKLKEEQKESKEITITTNNKALDTIKREITSAYINNYNSIVLAGENIEEFAEDIRKTIHDFIALEIAEQTSKTITAKDLLNLKEISIDKTLRRMDMILRSIIRDTIENKDKDICRSIFYRDHDVNRLYFLLFRLLKSSLNNQRIAENLGIEKTNILSRWYLNINLENIADCCKSICELMKNLDKKQLESAKKTYGLIEKDYLDVIKAYYNKDKKLADTVAKNRLNIVNECDTFIKKHEALATANIVQNFKELTNLISNIARIVIDEE